MAAKVLAPGGTYTQAVTALANGAHAVYAGVPGFNARRMISGDDSISSLNDLAGLIKTVHGMNGEVHCAMNILIRDDEMPKALRGVDALIQAGADIFIMQDDGLIQETLKRFPGTVIHASTQSAAGGYYGIKEAVSRGVKGIIFPRETPFKEIRELRRKFPGHHFEMFIHGALCYSFSGHCLFSSMIGGRSGNRGLCGQPCRRLYSRNGDDPAYWFSCRDLNLSARIGDIKEAGINYLKIEGRAKSPEYTAVVTRYYSDLLEKGRSELEDKIRYTFNRKFTEGLVFPGVDIINSEYVNSRGVFAGTLEEEKDRLFAFTAETGILKGDGLFVEGAERGVTAGESLSTGDKGHLSGSDLKKGMRIFKNRDADLADMVLIPEVKRQSVDISAARINLRYPIRRKHVSSRLYVTPPPGGFVPNDTSVDMVVLGTTENKLDTGLFFPHYGSHPPFPVKCDAVIAGSLEQEGYIREGGAEPVPWVTMNIFNTAAASRYSRFFFSLESSMNEILKNGHRDRGILFADGPLPLMHTYYPMEQGEYSDALGNRFSAIVSHGAGILYNGQRLLAVDYIPMVWNRIEGIYIDGSMDSPEEYRERLELYISLCSKLEEGLPSDDIRRKIKALSPYTKGRYGEGVL